MAGAGKDNEELADSGLYFTHLFEDRQVILTSDWQERAVPLAKFDFVHLRLFRPAAVDLVLTKMMRVDPEDRDDIQYLLMQTECRREELQSALARAVVPPVEEIRAAFEENCRWLKAQGI